VAFGLKRRARRLGDLPMGRLREFAAGLDELVNGALLD
jgi:hypothetical protein